VNEDSAAIDAYFKPIAATLLEFAQRHNLAHEKYPHGAIMWSLCFAHPQGGHAKIDLMEYAADQMKIASVWWIDDFRRFERRLKWGDKVLCPLDAGEAVRILDQVFMTILSWRPGEWTQIATGYEQSWGGYTREQFESMLPRWPLARS
jgi:hypothetical protein